MTYNETQTYDAYNTRQAQASRRALLLTASPKDAERIKGVTPDAGTELHSLGGTVFLMVTNNTSPETVALKIRNRADATDPFDIVELPSTLRQNAYGGFL